jgi:hypothetical protein
MLQVVVGLCFCGETHETGENHEDVATATQTATCFISYATTWPVRGRGQGQSGQGYGMDSRRTDLLGPDLGKSRGGTVCLAMKVLFKNLERLSGQAGDNARERLD